ncbi:uncharacterized protein LOC130284242 [Hyla sarda]|uniref:uncharacterized protein LOC130284242 n=1 Tax=Hyla sarda TaxID=327740 RepID=UPI0024C38D11|nr:uncharacterized protein LOC130284242 [Hyla sarda]
MNLLWSTVNVGIFSRDDESSYQWLSTRLSTNWYVRNVDSNILSNRSSAKFREDTRRCTFAILYHTKTRGRINITDVTDSLYDEELEHLSSEKGKDNVILVIDDLEGDGDNGHRTRILQNQPSIERLATEIFCFTAEEKRTLTRGGPAPEMVVKLRQIEKMIEERARRNIWRTIFRLSKVILILWVGDQILRGVMKKPGFWDICQKFLQKTNILSMKD